ncbi:MAG: peptidase MA family metallohydrolase [Anaerolineales bacterium]
MFNPRTFILKVVTILLMISISPLGSQQAKAQTGIAVENATVAMDFGKTITFSAKVTAPIRILQASLLFRGVDEKVTRVEAVQVGTDGQVSFTYDTSLNVFPPFSWIVFWYQATLEDGKTYTSSPIKFQYVDNRFPWRENTRDNVTVHWYAGDDAFGAAALDAAGSGLLAISDIIPVSLSAPINIYIYSNVDDLQSTLLLGGQQWAGGHANPELGAVLVSIAPSSTQKIEMETKIPHELAHVMMYQSLGENYNKQPAWLLEGVASMVELYPNPDYAHALEIASQNQTLLPFDQISASFPADSGSAYLAYAQSQSFMNYIRNTYGNTGITRLTQAYGDGLSPELGATNALGTSLSQLDKSWRENVLGQNVTGVALRNLSPFILLMALVLALPIWGTIDFLIRRSKYERQLQ